MMWINTIKFLYRRVALLFLCLSLISNAYSANEHTNIQKTIRYDSTAITVRKIPSKEINRLLNDPDYSYNQVSKAHRTPFDRFLEWLLRKFGESVDSKKSRLSITAIEYVFIALAFGLIIFLLLKNNIRSLFYGKSATTTIDFIESIEDINEINFDQRIADEVSRKDFRRAIRLHFLKVIKELSEHKLINWQLDKTNADYSKELRTTKYNQDFAELIRLYEYIWYGDFKLDETNFLLILQKFNQFKINQRD
jgi:hypothetical protein